jgi:phosphoglycolate phosphatase-like HAD superfamily hydrolase
MRSSIQFEGLFEIRPGFRPRPGLSHVLFDFDGTLSLIREGWPEVMLPMFEEMLPRRPGESGEAVRSLLHDDIMRLNGKQTIYQMVQFAERIQERGACPRDPLEYKNEYLRRLNERIRFRIESIAQGARTKDDFLVCGSRALLEECQRRGFRLYLASGTDEPFVKQEAALLDIDRYFDGRIYGARDDYKSFSKKMVIQRILRDNCISGEQLLAFGDGYVEIENTKEVGGLAVAVASDEAHNGSGRMDPWKRDRLAGVGADLIIPDYRDGKALLDLLLSPCP